jgi:hypothetical protein
VEANNQVVSRARRRKLIKKIDKELVDLYPEYNRLMKWWHGLHATVKKKVAEAKKPGVKYKQLQEVHGNVVSLLNHKRRLKGESKHPDGIERTLRRSRK